MKPESILRSDIYDIIFDGRNKEYGAYDLRKKYNQRLLKAIAIVTIFVLAFTIVTFFNNHSPATLSTKITSHFFDTLPTVLAPPEPQPPPRSAKPVHPAATIKNATPLILKENLVDPIPQLNELDNSIQAGLKTSMGDSALQIAPALEIGKNSLHNERMVEPITKENKVHHYADRMPAFPGGDKELRRFLERNLKIPEQSVSPGQSIRVDVQFVVDSEGNVTGIKFENSPGETFKQEIIRVMKKMPKWKPGVLNGEKVSVYFKIPVVFEIPEE